MATLSSIATDIASLPDEERQQLYKVVGVGPPPAAWIGPIWVIVVLAFAGVLLGGGFLVYLLVQDGKATDALLPIVTAAVGVLAGILAPSPVSQTGQR